jgi:hypothetical protein
LGAALQADGETRSALSGLKHQKEKRSMDHFAGLDVSVKETSVCIVDETGKIVREVKVASEPEALLAVLKNPAYHFKRIGLEAGPLSQWLYSALAEAGLPVICVETRHMRAVLKAQINKTDRNDARGMAQMPRPSLAPVGTGPGSLVCVTSCRMTPKFMNSRGSKQVRCAIYTRVSTEQGLEQDFNSLDAQYEASQAYIKSQAHAGWMLIRSKYDDGGFSGGNTDRPALQRLLDDVRAGKVDVIVVYKVDRLTRSLADFAKLVEPHTANTERVRFIPDPAVKEDR